MVKITKGLSMMASAACFSTLLFMSSCSKEDAVTPTPEVVINENSNQKANLVSSGYELFFGIRSTDNGTPGLNVFPTGWEKNITEFPDDLTLRPAGTSTLTHLWGQFSTPWIKPLEAPYRNSGNKIVTFVHQRNIITLGGGTISKVKTKIKKLVPGKKYEVTFYTAATIRNFGGKPSQYSNGGLVLEVGNVDARVDLVGKEAEWVKQTIEFVAGASEVDVRITPYRNGPEWGDEAVNAKFLIYYNVFVGENAVKEIN